jgi:hypothetical protein
MNAEKETAPTPNQMLNAAQNNPSNKSARAGNRGYQPNAPAEN